MSGEEGNSGLDVTANPGKEKELSSSVVESYGLVIGEELGFSDVSDLKKMVRRWRGCVTRDAFREISNDLVNVGDHVDLDGAACGEIEGHTKVFMDGATSGGEFLIGRIEAVG